ncbi:MAG TPA: M48 family metallopeptidase [Actinomycetota bacterium]|nr:M48 family metallopeptidase [Actinomycetota bacterium]
MSTIRALLIVGLLSCASAAIVGLASRAPAEIRNAKPGPEATDPSLGAKFTDEQIARHGIYRRAGYIGFVLGVILEIVVLVLLARGPFGRLVASVEKWPGGLVVHAAAVGAAVAIITTVAALPLSFVRGYVIAKAWGLSTQNLAGWFSDLAKGLGIGAVMAGVAALAFFAIVRWQPRAWWIVGFAAFSALSVLLVWLYPVAIAPIFNNFTPLKDPVLTERIMDLASKAGVEVDEVLVADASRRTTSENAYVAGLGPTKQVVVYDTLLVSGGEDETAFVVAHELGHQRENHVVKSLLFSFVGLLAGFGVLKLLSARAGVWEWGGASDISDLRALPVLLLFAVIAGLLTLPVQNTVSRGFESRADEIAIDLTGDPATAVRSFRRLAFSNLADLRPPRLAVILLFTHPPIPERIEKALAAMPGGP